MAISKGNIKKNGSSISGGSSSSGRYRGQWDASTNTPTLSNPPTSPTWKEGDYYEVSAAGTQFSIDWTVNDEIVAASDGASGLEWVKRERGDVDGPASSINNNIAVFNGTTGKLLKDGGKTVEQINSINSQTDITSNTTLTDWGVFVKNESGDNILTLPTITGNLGRKVVVYNLLGSVTVKDSDGDTITILENSGQTATLLAGNSQPEVIARDIFPDSNTIIINGDGELEVSDIYLKKANNLSDVENVASARNNLGLSYYQNIKNNFTATRDPDNNDDTINEGYEVGSQWLYANNERFWTMKSGTEFAAVWIRLLTASLDSAKILVGNSSNEATPVDMSGDATIDNVGALTLDSLLKGNAFTNGDLNPIGSSVTLSQYSFVVYSAGVQTIKLADHTAASNIGKQVAIINSSDTCAIVDKDNNPIITLTKTNEAVILAAADSNGIAKIAHANEISVDNVTIEVNGSGDIAVKDNGISTAKIANNAVTFSKIQQATAYTFLGNNAGVTQNVGLFDKDEAMDMMGATYGAASSTDSNFVLFDGTDGKRIKDGGAKTASNIAFVAAGSISSTNVQDAIEELDTVFVGDSGSGGAAGLVPAPASGDAAANKYLNADGTWKSISDNSDLVWNSTSTSNTTLAWGNAYLFNANAADKFMKQPSTTPEDSIIFIENVGDYPMFIKDSGGVSIVDVIVAGGSLEYSSNGSSLVVRNRYIPPMRSVLVTSSTYQANLNEIVKANPTSNAITITLPDCSASYFAGLRCSVFPYVSNSNSLTVSAYSGQSFNATGETDIILDFTDTNTAGQFLGIISDGNNPIVCSNVLTAAKYSLPVGSILAMGYDSSTPAGYLYCNNAAVSRTTYAALFSAIGTVWGSGDGSTTFNLPRFRGKFLRGYDDGAGIDSGRVFGANQLDAFQGHYHNVLTNSSANGQSSSYNNPYAGWNGAVWTSTANHGAREPVTDNTNGTPRTASETRPNNETVKYYIKY